MYVHIPLSATFESLLHFCNFKLKMPKRIEEHYEENLKNTSLTSEHTPQTSC